MPDAQDSLAQSVRFLSRDDRPVGGWIAEIRQPPQLVRQLAE